MWITHDLIGFSKLKKVSGVLRLSAARVRDEFADVRRTSVAGRLSSARLSRSRDTARRERRPASGATTPRTTARPSTRRSIRSTKTTSSTLRVAWRRPQADPALLAANPDIRLSNRYTATPIMVNGVLYAPDGFGLVEAHRSGDRPDAVDAEAADARRRTACRAAAPTGASRTGARAPRRASSARAPSICSRSTRRPASRSPISATAARSISTSGLGPLMKSFRWSGVPLIARDVVVIGSSMLEQDSARTKEGPPGDVRALRRPHRQAALDLPRHSARRRAGRRDLGERLVHLHRRRQRLVDDERGRRSRLRVSADVERHQRHVRRAPAGQQPLHQLDRLPRRQDRQARLALPDRAPRSVRLRQPGGADPRRHHRGRTADQGGRAGHQARASCSCSIA